AGSGFSNQARAATLLLPFTASPFGLLRAFPVETSNDLLRSLLHCIQPAGNWPGSPLSNDSRKDGAADVLGAEGTSSLLPGGSCSSHTSSEDGAPEAGAAAGRLSSFLVGGSCCCAACIEDVAGLPCSSRFLSS